MTMLTDPIDTLKDANKKLQQAEFLRGQKEYAKAEAICLSLLKEYPDYYGALHTIGLVYGDKGEHNKAVSYLVQAAMLNPRSWLTLTALGGEYLLLNAREMAIQTLNAALKLNDQEPAIFVTLGEVYYGQRDYLLASKNYLKALELEPNMPEAVMGYAEALVQMGDYETASQALHELLAVTPPTPHKLRLLASLPTHLIQRNVLVDLDKCGTRDPTILAFTRSVALDKVGQHDEAWKWAVKANNSIADTMRSEIAAELHQVETRVRWFQKNRAHFKERDHGNKEYPMSLFILGVSRSGKTTAESLIASQAGVKRGYENPAIETAVKSGYQTGGLISMKSIAQLPVQLYSPVRAVYREILTELMGEDQLFTNTSPGHIWDAPFFYNGIPNTRFVFIKRDIDDLSWRIYQKKYNRSNTYSYDLKALRRYITLYYEMVDLFCETFPFVSRVITYEEMVADPGTALDQMCELCGIAADRDLLPQIGDDRGCADPYKQRMNP